MCVWGGGGGGMQERYNDLSHSYQYHDERPIKKFAEMGFLYVHVTGKENLNFRGIFGHIKQKKSKKLLSYQH